jgi:hypothetical protein
MDLSQRDIRTHARPYAFDRFQEEGSSRLSPRYSGEFFRAAAINASGSQKIYAEWFRDEIARYPGRLCSLGNNNPVFDILKAGQEGPGSGKRQKPRPAFRVVPCPGKSRDPARDGIEILLAALEKGGSPERVFGGLAPLLLPENPCEYGGESGRLLAEEIKLLAGGCGSRHG